jgi:hypothetical protein
MSDIPAQPPKCDKCVPLRKVDSRLPDNIVLCIDGTVREVFPDAREVLIEPEVNRNGTAYISFKGRGSKSGEDYKFWVAQGMYRAFWGPIKDDERVLFIDGDRKNLHPSNLALEPKPVFTYELVRKKRPDTNGTPDQSPDQS